MHTILNTQPYYYKPPPSLCFQTGFLIPVNYELITITGRQPAAYIVSSLVQLLCHGLWYLLKRESNSYCHRDNTSSRAYILSINRSFLHMDYIASFIRLESVRCDTSYTVRRWLMLRASNAVLLLPLRSIQVDFTCLCYFLKRLCLHRHSSTSTLRSGHSRSTTSKIWILKPSKQFRISLYHAYEGKLQENCHQTRKIAPYHGNRIYFRIFSTYMTSLNTSRFYLYLTTNADCHDHLRLLHLPWPSSTAERAHRPRTISNDSSLL